MSVDLFTPRVSPDKFHHNFKAALHRSSVGERAVLEKWASTFTDRDGKFVEEFQTTFNTAYWELYLHAVLEELGVSVNWSFERPDFVASKDGVNFCIEATTANAAAGKPKEWERKYPDVPPNAFHIPTINREATIRLSNSIQAKYLKYKKDYYKLNQVAGKPFVMAVGPFEQPYFYFQHDRPIRSLLYDYYVDEEAYKNDPSKYPLGPPGVNLGTIEKDNGSEIELGFFNSPVMDEVSAVVFTCTATWGKLNALSSVSPKHSFFNYMRHDENGVPRMFTGIDKEKYRESLVDGLQIYHNPHAKYPLPPAIFRKEGIVQHYYDGETDDWVYEGVPGSLTWRQTFGFISPEAGELETVEVK